MKIKVVFLSVLFVSSIFTYTDAQVGNYVRSKAGSATRRAGQQTDKEVDKEINKAVDQGVTNVFNKLRKEGEQPENEESQPDEAGQPVQSSQKPTSSSRSGSSGNDAMSKALMGKLGISMERPANVKDTYNYSSNLVMGVQSWDSNGDTEGEELYTTHYTSDNKGFAMDFRSQEKGDARMIFDYENQIMIILSDDGKDKTGMVMAYGAYQSPDSAFSEVNTTDIEKVENEDYTDYYSSFKKTGRTKVISGYKCDEYEFEDEESKASYWITSDLPAELWANMFGANAIASVYAGRPNGFIMEWNNEEKETEEKSHMLVKEVNKNQSTSLSTAEYTFMSFGGMQNNSQEGK